MLSVKIRTIQLIMLLMSIMACSCIGTAEQSSVIKLGESNKTVQFCDIVDSVSLTVLTEDSTCIVGEIKKVEETISNYFVMNQQKTAIAKFDKNGAFVERLHKVGRSKDEYIGINDFSVDEQNNMIVLLCDYTKLHVYDLSFKLKQAFNLSVPLERICVYKSKIFGYSAIDNKIVCMSNGEFKDVVKGEKPKSWIYSQTQVFFKTDGLLLASLECDTIIYRIDNNGVSRHISFLYDGYEDIIDQYRESDVESSNGLVVNTPVRIRNVHSNENVLNVIYAKDMVVRCALIDLIDQKIISDGIFIGSPSPEWNGRCNEMIAGEFANGIDLPIDSAYMNKITTPHDKSIFGSVIVKYHLK